MQEKKGLGNQIKCIHCMKKAEVIHYGSSFCLEHFAKERLIRTLSFKEMRKMEKMSNEEVEKELERMIKEGPSRIKNWDSK